MDQVVGQCFQRNAIGAKVRNVRGVLVRDTLDELVDPKVTAIVVIDVENDFCHPEGLFAKAGKDMSAIYSAVPRIASFIKRGRELGIRAIFVQQTTLRENRSDPPAYLYFKVRDGKAPDYTVEGTWGAEFIEELQVGPTDLVIRKTRSDAFLHTNLDQVLRAGGIETLVVLGVVTEGCVEATVRSGVHHDYYVVVVRDCVASANRELHEGSMRLMESRHIVRDSEEIIESWKHNAPVVKR